MNLERAREILKEKGFIVDESLCKNYGEGYFFESYRNGDDNIVEINVSSNDKTFEVKVHAPYYCYDWQDEEPGILLATEDEKFPLREDLFRRALEIQEYGLIKFKMNFCKFYFEFSKWYTEELEPALKHLSLRVMTDPLYFNYLNNFELPLNYYFVNEENEYGDGELYVNVKIDSFIFKVSIIVGLNDRIEKEEDFSELYGESSGIILSAIEEFLDE